MRSLLAVVVGAGMAIGCAPFVWAEATVGQPAPDFTLTDTHGHSRSLTEFADHFVVLEWFNKDCPFVRKQYGGGTMQHLQETAAGRGVIWLTMVSSAPGKQGYIAPEEGDAVIAERGAHPTAMLLDSDGTVGRRYGAKTTPHLFLVSPRGVVI